MTNKLTLGKQESRKWMGVCSGLAEYMEIDVTAVRLCVVLLALVTGLFAVTIAYCIARIVIPDRPNE